MMSWKETLKAMNEIQAVCWECKIELREEEIYTITDGNSLHIEVCFDCYKNRGAGELTELDPFHG
ncbi:hypothetical protein [Halobacillus karajensis]|uniref:Uncharacterized protein n=2 Tax=Halobacillus karajensis TaxID=195088 RepID=A0A024P3H5_9BACI|nr:hypothetical protein [Halobacillus karajensis]CDQ18862.1 hypothetical protein BN982_01143 [Halobacillus karajensis]CDQ23065.1 hypothetical protein BN983_01284 [Halobacillus karajensis]CDQ26547.1 hypothetical protein BN981_00764 [Halobacillus karajensis]